MPKIESTEAVVRLAVAVALQAAEEIRKTAEILRRKGTLPRELEAELRLSTAVAYFETKNGLWAATRAVLDCDEIDLLPGFRRDLALVRRWLDERRHERTSATDVPAD